MIVWIQYPFISTYHCIAVLLCSLKPLVLNTSVILVMKVSQHLRNLERSLSRTVLGKQIYNMHDLSAVGRDMMSYVYSIYSSLKALSILCPQRS